MEEDEEAKRRQMMGVLIRKHREEVMKWSQDTLAARAGVTQAAISAYEAGHRVPKWPELRRLAAALQVDARKIIGPLVDDLGHAREGEHDPGAGA